MRDRRPLSGFRPLSLARVSTSCCPTLKTPKLQLKKSLGWLSLTSLGIGAVIGSGIFTIVGTAIAGQKLQASSILNAPLLEYLIHHSASFGRPGAGPAIALSFILVAIVCGFASVCYAELAAMIPIAGSAYTYTYATMGELIAWIIGWDLILEYAVSNMAVSVGFSAHMVDLLDWFGVHPDPLDFACLSSQRPLRSARQHALRSRLALRLQLAGFLIVMLLTVILVRGIRESAETNNVMVLPENCRDSGLRHFRGALHSSCQLASLCSQRLARHPDRRLHRFLHLHRIRFRLDRRRGMQKSAARPAASASSPRWSSARFSTSA